MGISGPRTRRALLHAGLALAAASTATIVGGCSLAPTAWFGGSRTVRIGLLLPAGPASWVEPSVAAFKDAIHSLGYAEGQNLVLLREEYENSSVAGQVASSVGRLVASNVDAIVGTVVPTRVVDMVRAAGSTPIVHPLMTSTIVGTPVVASLARPGGNISGFIVSSPEQYARRAQVLKESVPRISRVGFLAGWGIEPIGLPEATAAGIGLGVTVSLLQPKGPDDIEPTLAAAVAAGTDGLLIWQNGGGGEMAAATTRARLLGLVQRLRLPSIGADLEWAREGGLLGLAPNFPANWARAADYVDRVLKGTRIGDLPIQQPTRFDLVLNERTVKALDLTMPASVLAQVTEIVRS